MSGSKLELLWSPCHEDRFLTYSSTISIYHIETVKDGETPKGPLISDYSYAVLAGSNSDINYVKCVAWYPRPEPEDLLAIGQASGKVTLTSFSTSNPMDDLIGREFATKHSRQCNFLSWNMAECNLLAEGLEKHRNDPCILIWDINTTGFSDISLSSERQRHSYSEPGTISKPAYEMAQAECAVSFSWVNDSRAFVAGISNKALRLYDLRETSRPQVTANHKCVSGVCIDPLNPYHLASFGENIVALWDIRYFDKPILTYQESKPVLKISWCPTKKGTFSVLCKDSPVVKMCNIEHSSGGKSADDVEPTLIERIMQPFFQYQVASFAWNPLVENKLLVVSTTGVFKEITVFDRIPVVFSPLGRLTWAYGKKMIDIPRCPVTNDISERMQYRAIAGYGLQEQNIWENALLVQPEPNLLGLWRWLAFLLGVADEEFVVPGSRSHLYLGIKGLLKLDHYPDTIPYTTPQLASWRGLEGAPPVSQFCNAARSRALQLCGWSSKQEGNMSLDLLLQRLQDNGEHEKAAAVAVFNLHIDKALNILGHANSREDRSHLNAVAMALAGFGDKKNTLWQRTCSQFRFQLKNPYLRALFAFLASDHLEDVLQEQEMEVSDRVAFACTYLSDLQLKDYITELTNELKKTGNLDGLLLIGMSTEGVDLLERYVDLTGDVQTAALAATYAYPPGVEKDERVEKWIQVYCDLLNQWRLWHQRAKFDILRHAKDPSHRVMPQGYVSCNYCGKSITSTTTINRSHMVGRAVSYKPKVTCCPNCRKSLPRCDLCLTNLGTASGTGELIMKDLQGHKKLSAFSEWFIWCQTCRHGGHSSHVRQWFKEHSECPVTNCECKCLTVDFISHLENQKE